MNLRKIIIATAILGAFGYSIHKDNEPKQPTEEKLVHVRSALAENLNQDGSVNANEKNFADKATDEVGKYINKETLNNTENKAKEIFNKENASKVKDKVSDMNGSDKATELKEKIKNETLSIWDKAKNMFHSSKKSDNNDVKSNVANAELSNLTFTSGAQTVQNVNGGKSTLNKEDWKTSKIVFSQLDQYNRVGTATAYLDKSNVGKSEGRDGQTWKPTGWKNQPKKVNGKRVIPFDRGHLIAYTLTFNLDNNGNYSQGKEGSINNPLNLATQTQYTNRVLFQKYEGIIRDELKSGGKVIYQVTPVFKDNELLARGFHMQALSLDGSVNFNVFIFNVISGLEMNYSDGSSVVNNQFYAK